MYQTARSTKNRLVLTGILWTVLLADAAHADDAVATGSFLATLDHATYFERAAALHELLEHSDTTDLQSYLAAARGIQRVGMRKAWSGIVYARYAQIDPQGAVDHILQTGDNYQLEYLYATFCNWSEADPEAAIARSQLLVRLSQREVAKQAILSAHSELDSAGLAALAQRLGPPTETGIDVVLAQRIDHLARSKPDTALEQAMAIDNFELRRPLLQSIGKAWAAQAPEQALLASERLSDPPSRQAFREGVITELALSDPDALLAALDSDTYSRAEQLGIIRYVFTDLAGRNPELGMHMTNQLPDQDLRLQARIALLGALSSAPPSQLLELMDLADDTERESLLMSYGSNALARLALEDPEAALARAQAVPRLAPQLVPEVVTVMARQDSANALRVTNQLGSAQLRAEALSAVILAVAETDPKLAIESLSMVPHTGRRQGVLDQVVLRWVQHDSAAAIAWVLSRPEPQRGVLLERIQYTVFQQDLALAMSVFEQLEPGKTRDGWSAEIVQHLARTDPDKAIAWLYEHPGLEREAGLVDQLSSSLARHDLSQALAFAEGLPRGPTQNAAFQAIVGQWASWDAPAAGAYIERLDDGVDRDSLVPGVTTQWAQYDPDAAVNWIMGLAEPNLRDQGLASLMHDASSLGLDPMNLAKAISDVDVRGEALNGYFQMLAYQDPEAAQEFLQRSDLPDEFREQWSDFLRQMEVNLH